MARSLLRVDGIASGAMPPRGFSLAEPAILREAHPELAIAFAAFDCPLYHGESTAPITAYHPPMLQFLPLIS